MRTRIALFLLVTLWTPTATSQPSSIITIGLQDFEEAQRIRCQAVTGAFEWIIVENGQLRAARKLDGIQEIAKTNLGYTVTTKTDEMQASYIILKPAEGRDIIRLISDPTGYRQYAGAVHFYWHANDWHIALEADLEDYVAGVLVSEVGKGQANALYTAHAVVSRTYALNNLEKHRLTGYDVCDQVHCQAFDGVSTVNDAIRMGCRASKHMVLVDRLGRPIPAAFHSNCGGITRSSARVWQKASPHLLPVQDSACSFGEHAQWKRQILRKDWNIWQKDQSVDLDNKTLVRARLGLPSDRFDVGDAGDALILSGRGFGHGVGLCQEGAMERANKGASPWAILDAYYQEIWLRPLSQITAPQAPGVSNR